MRPRENYVLSIRDNNINISVSTSIDTPFIEIIKEVSQRYIPGAVGSLVHSGGNVNPLGTLRQIDRFRSFPHMTIYVACRYYACLHKMQRALSGLSEEGSATKKEALTSYTERLEMPLLKKMLTERRAFLKDSLAIFPTPLIDMVLAYHLFDTYGLDRACRMMNKERLVYLGAFKLNPTRTTVIARLGEVLSQSELTTPLSNVAAFATYEALIVDFNLAFQFAPPLVIDKLNKIFEKATCDFEKNGFLYEFNPNKFIMSVISQVLELISRSRSPQSLVNSVARIISDYSKEVTRAASDAIQISTSEEDKMDGILQPFVDSTKKAMKKLKITVIKRPEAEDRWALHAVGPEAGKVAQKLVETLNGEFKLPVESAFRREQATTELTGQVIHNTEKRMPSVGAAKTYFEIMMRPAAALNHVRASRAGSSSALARFTAIKASAAPVNNNLGSGTPNVSCNRL
jgi:hypothetical protein